MVWRVVGFFLFSLVLPVLCNRASCQLPPCYAGFEISQACIAERGLVDKVAIYTRNVAAAMAALGASYKVNLRVVNNPEQGGYDPSVADVFTEVIRDDQMQNQSFVITVTSEFLQRQPEILFEASAYHEICHIMNDDLPG